MDGLFNSIKVIGWYLKMFPRDGGNWNNGSNAGVFNRNWNNWRSNDNNNNGFRAGADSEPNLKHPNGDTGTKGDIHPGIYAKICGSLCFIHIRI